MGSLSSKSYQPDQSLEIVNEADVCVPICNGDPRSPSLNIERTPLQQTGNGQNSKVTKNVDLTKECFKKYEEVPLNPALRAVMNDYDPRSPTLDFERTPLAFLLKDPNWVASHNSLNTSAILDVADESDNVKELQPKNLCHDLENMSLQSEDEIQIEIEHFKNEMKNSEDEVCEEETNCVGLLETNFDYLETDVDTVRRQKCKEFNDKVKHITTEVKSEIVERKIVGDTVVENIVQEVVSDDVAYTDLSDKDPRSPSDGINRTPILVVEKETIVAESKKIKSSKKINSTVKEVLRNNAMLQKNFYQDAFKDSDVKTIAKDSMLIYEDKIENVTPVSSSKSNPTTQQNTESSRTPLACMMNVDKIGSSNNTPLNSANKIIQSKIPVRVSKISPGQLSDIKLIKPYIGRNDLENTPPKPRKACWDRDSSVIL